VSSYAEYSNLVTLSNTSDYRADGLELGLLVCKADSPMRC